VWADDKVDGWAKQRGDAPGEAGRFLEATYALDQDEGAWLEGVMATSRKVWGRPAFAVAATYDVSDPAHFRPGSVVSDFPPDLMKVHLRGPAMMTREYVERTFRRLLAGVSRKISEPEQISMWADIVKLGLGISDQLVINGLDPGGLGCMVGLTMTNRRDMRAGELATCKRMALHIAAAYRCRRRLGASAGSNARPDLTVGAEAVLDARGRVLDARGPAQDRASQDELKMALARFDAARSRRHGRDPIGGLDAYRALVDTRWTLVDAYERTGTRYVVARENQAAVRGLEALTDRERQVAVYVTLGRSTKEIAYALGISDSTVRVLLSRAGSRLRVRSREQLIRQVTVDALPELDERSPTRVGREAK
jgi:DNA-binding CsgD family transcriptional regulator